MDKVRKDTQKVGYAILNLIMTYVELDKKTRYYGTDVPIFHSEIHMISTIATHPGIHVGGLAELLGVTKGSVSEIIKKLEQKVLVIKETDAQNLSRLSLRLTEKGMQAHRHHMRYHAVIDELLEEELKDVSPRDVQFLLSFLSNFKARMDELNQIIEKGR